MTNERILLVEPDENIRNQLVTTLTAFGYQVDILPTAQSLLNVLQLSGKQLIMLSAAVPDAPEQLKNLHSSRFRHVPYVITAFHRKLDRAELIAVLEWGNKTYDFLSIEHLPNLYERIDQIFDPYKYSKEYQAGLARQREREAFEALLKEQIASDRPWAYFDIRLRQDEEYSELYGWQALEAVTSDVSKVITGVQTQHSTPADQWLRFWRNNWVGVTYIRQPQAFVEALRTPFLERIKLHYNPVDWERGCMIVLDEKGIHQMYPLLHLAIGILTPKQHEYKSFMEVYDAGAIQRRSSPVLV
jgi:CheY-like chemotaxis protein